MKCTDGGECGTGGYCNDCKLGREQMNREQKEKVLILNVGNFSALEQCPYHEEKTPSLIISNGTFVCLSCGAVGAVEGGSLTLKIEIPGESK